MSLSWKEIEKNLRETYWQKRDDEAVIFAQEEVMDCIRRLALPQVPRKKNPFLGVALSWSSQVLAFMVLALIFVWGLHTLHKDLQTSIPASFYATKILAYGE